MPRSWERRSERRSERRKARRREKRDARMEKISAQRTALRGRDEHTGGYGDATYPGP
jgi:hypothetical protein